MSKFETKDLNGVMPAMITSFNKDESINKEGLRKIINHLIAEKVSGLYVTGSTGETFLMSPEEKKKVIDIIVEEVNGRVPVIAHVGSIGTKITADLADYATKAGVLGPQERMIGEQLCWPKRRNKIGLFSFRCRD